jgi:hypothetical protein
VELVCFSANTLTIHFDGDEGRRADKTVEEVSALVAGGRTPDLRATEWPKAEERDARRGDAEGDGDDKDEHPAAVG